ncbi:MAG: fibronectin type III domain-containing protein [Dehalococcoidia bacterium]|nr:fibronectin type III domain-containing protein [Dehalococcoidia bacterium]
MFDAQPEPRWTPARSQLVLMWAALAVCAVTAQVVTVTDSLGIFGHAAMNTGVMTTATVQPPASLVVLDQQQTSVDLQWTASGTAFVTGYEVYRSDTPAGARVLVGAVGAGTLTLTDGTLAPGTTYYFVVRAIASGWVSAESMQVMATTLP